MNIHEEAALDVRTVKRINSRVNGNFREKRETYLGDRLDAAGNVDKFKKVGVLKQNLTIANLCESLQVSYDSARNFV